MLKSTIYYIISDFVRNAHYFLNFINKNKIFCTNGYMKYKKMS